MTLDLKLKEITEIELNSSLKI